MSKHYLYNIMNHWISNHLIKNKRHIIAYAIQDDFGICFYCELPDGQHIDMMAMTQLDVDIVDSLMPLSPDITLDQLRDYLKRATEIIKGVVASVKKKTDCHS